MENFDPNGVGVQNGHIFGLPYNLNDAEIVILPVPWDLTASYGKGCANGPEQILQASSQLDYFDFNFPKSYETKVFMAPINERWKQINDDLAPLSISYIDFLESGGQVENNPKFTGVLNQINDACDQLQDEIAQEVSALHASGKKIILLGGEHAAPLSYIQFLSQKHDHFSILQMDAHADLRITYEGFKHSHASIFNNVLQNTSNVRLTQVGIRDLCDQEYQMAQEDSRINMFSMPFITQLRAQGKTWDDICHKIIDTLEDKVYLSVDIDGLDAHYCPNTGTPVPGGYSFQEQDYLFNLLSKKRQIIGADLCEVGDAEWDANVGMRVLWKICLLLNR